MKFQEQKRYPYPTDVVVQVFSDKDYFLNKYQMAGARNIELLEDTRQDNRSRITISREMAIDINVPAFARKFVPSNIIIVQTDAWHVVDKTGRIDIQFKGAPADVRCDMSLTDDNGESVLDLRFSVTVNVPLIGDKLANVLAQDLSKKYQRDSTQSQKVMADIASRYL